MGALTQLREIRGLAWPDLAMPARKPSRLPAFEPPTMATPQVVDSSMWLVPAGPLPRVNNVYVGTAGRSAYANNGHCSY